MDSSVSLCSSSSPSLNPMISLFVLVGVSSTSNGSSWNTAAATSDGGVRSSEGNTSAITSADGYSDFYGIACSAGDEFCFTVKDFCNVTPMSWPLSLIISSSKACIPWSSFCCFTIPEFRSVKCRNISRNWPIYPAATKGWLVRASGNLPWVFTLSLLIDNSSCDAKENDNLRLFPHLEHVYIAKWLTID